MVDVAKVRMFGQDIGTFVWEDSYRVARFEYDKVLQAELAMQISQLILPAKTLLKNDFN